MLSYSTQAPHWKGRVSLGVTCKRSPCRPLSIMTNAHGIFRSRLSLNGRRACKIMKCSSPLRPSLVININPSRSITGCRKSHTPPRDAVANIHAFATKLEALKIYNSRTLACSSTEFHMQESNGWRAAPLAQAFRNPQRAACTLRINALISDRPTHSATRLLTN